MNPNAFKICALCRHLETVETGREFEDIADSEYSVFRCQKINQEIREDYLMTSIPVELALPANSSVCPYWEKCDDNGLDRFVGLPDFSDSFWDGLLDDINKENEAPEA